MAFELKFERIHYLPFPVVFLMQARKSSCSKIPNLFWCLIFRDRHFVFPHHLIENSGATLSILELEECILEELEEQATSLTLGSNPE